MVGWGGWGVCVNKGGAWFNWRLGMSGEMRRDGEEGAKRGQGQGGAWLDRLLAMVWGCNGGQGQGGVGVNGRLGLKEGQGRAVRQGGAGYGGCAGGAGGCSRPPASPAVVPAPPIRAHALTASVQPCCQGALMQWQSRVTHPLCLRPSCCKPAPLATAPCPSIGAPSTPVFRAGSSGSLSTSAEY